MNKVRSLTQEQKDEGYLKWVKRIQHVELACKGISLEERKSIYLKKASPIIINCYNILLKWWNPQAYPKTSLIKRLIRRR